MQCGGVHSAHIRSAPRWPRGYPLRIHSCINSLFHAGKKTRKGLTDNEAERGLGRASGTTSEQVLDGAAGLQAHEGVVLPPGDRAPLGIHEALLENVVEDVLEVEEAHHVADVDELGSDLLLSARRLVVGDPELGSLNRGAVDLRAEC